MTVGRIKYSKGDEMKYISHLDFQRSFQRLLNRSGIPVAYSQGFNPHPKIAFAMAMPVGMTSEAEYLDIELSEHISPEDIKARLNEYAPRGLKITEVKIHKKPIKSLSSVVSRGIFKAQISLNKGITEEDARKEIESLLELDQIKISRKNKKGKIVTKNIRPMIHRLEVEKVEDERLYLKMELSMGSKENLSPQNLINYLIEHHKIFLDFPAAKLHRVGMAFE